MIFAAEWFPNLRLMRSLLLLLLPAIALAQTASNRPNIVLIYADDIGYGDIGSYGGKVATPNLDRIAREGLRFTDAHTTSATCTPSRYSLLVGEYAWRKPGTGIARGDAALIPPTNRATLASVLRGAGYRTSVIGKWHLGVGPGPGKTNWNAEIRPGPLELGFDYCFIMAATGDRVPCVYIENRHVVNADPNDPIVVNYDGPIEGEPTGAKNPELLTKMRPSHGHDMAIVNGISRIGHMKGGKAARWVDEEMADIFTAKALAEIDRRGSKPFFLFFSTQDIHVPRVPHPRFAGKTPYGPRGDCIAQLDWCVGEILKTLDRLNLARDTMVIFSSDNGPVIDDGYEDEAVTKLKDQKPAGGWRGGKYSNFEAGTRVPFLLRWPARVKPGVSDALVSQVDFIGTMAKLTGQQLATEDAPDSLDMLATWLGESKHGRDELVEHAGVLSLRQGAWKFIEPGRGPAINRNTNTELGNAPEPQLYDLASDPGETKNLAAGQPERAKAMQARLQALREAGRTRR